MQDFTTPMMKQYMEVKRRYPDCLLFFRMGDFYELFMEDAHLGSRILNITLTHKSGGKDGKIPMAGVPYHAVDSYIAKLVQAGYKVAICEQLSPPSKKGLVKRDVVRIVTPGTLLDEKTLEKKENNYIVSITKDSETVGLAVADLSTGYFALGEENSIDSIPFLLNTLAGLKPTECILPDELYNEPEFLTILKKQKTMNIFPYTGYPSDKTSAIKLLRKHFHVATLEGFGVSDQVASSLAGAGLLSYLKETQHGELNHIKRIMPLSDNDSLLLDRSTMVNLELFATIREHDTKGSLLTVMDQTITAMGGRLLKNWLKKPLIDKDAIEARLNSVETFNQNNELREHIREQFKLIPDIERLLSRLSVNLGNARDLINVMHSLAAILQTKSYLKDIQSSLIAEQNKNISPEIQKVIDIIDRAIVAEPPISTKDGGMIKDGINKTLDSYRQSILHSKDWIKSLEKKERQRTGIGSLKVKFNKVFGFYIEVSKANLTHIPKDYMRKQTLVNAERFITKELKKHEDIILSAEEKINELEYKIFSDILEEILTYIESIQKCAQSIAIVDCIISLSVLSETARYVRPKLLYSGEIRIKQGRHPVVEKMLDSSAFVPNDISLDNVSQALLLITGPNMAGKSVLIRQVALIILMAQIGSFVPAQSAHLSIVDKIFVRSGASDVITGGLSTFMVEMVETAYILHNVTSNSLVVMDEIGRGTSTYDGISLAWAVAESFVTRNGKVPKVLFATHYHELQALEEEYPNKIKNFHMAVTEQDGEPIFLHTLLAGGASHSFGIAVAKLAGVPDSVIQRAKEMLSLLEERSIEKESMAKTSFQIDSPSLIDHFVIKEINTLDIASITPLQALNILAALKDKLILARNEQKLLEKD